MRERKEKKIPLVKKKKSVQTGNGTKSTEDSRAPSRFTIASERKQKKIPLVLVDAWCNG